MKNLQKLTIFVMFSIMLTVAGVLVTAQTIVNMLTYNLDPYFTNNHAWVNTRTGYRTNGSSISVPAYFLRSLIEWDKTSADQYNWTYSPVSAQTNPAGGSTYSLVVNITDAQIDSTSYEIYSPWLNLSQQDLVTARNNQYAVHFYYVPYYPENSDYTAALEVTTNTTRNQLVDVGLIFFNSTSVTDFVGNVGNVSIAPVNVGSGKNRVTWYNISFIIQGYNTNINENFTTAIKFGWSYSCITCGGAPTGNYYYLINHE